MADVSENSQLQALQRRVDELSVEVSEQVSLAVAGWREKEVELLRMLQSQQEELQQLRVQQYSLHCRLSQQGSSSALDVGKAPAASIECQWHEWLTELSKVQQDHKQLLAGESSPAAASSHACISLRQEVVTDTLSLLKELKDERCIVADMLDTVKQEKCEVIAMMHMFATSKNEAMEELDGLRQTARDEISAFAVHARPLAAAAATVGRGRQCEVTSARSDGREVADHELHTEPVRIATIHGLRAGSHTTLCPALLQAPTVPIAAGIHGLARPPGAALGAASVAATGAASSRDQRRHSTGVAAAEPSVQSPCSPARQYSAGVSMTRVLSVNTACSPPMLPRPAVATAETQKSPVRRFFSGSPVQPEKVGRGPSSSASWTTMSQGPLIR